MVTVRLATLDDLNFVADQVVALHGETVWKDLCGPPDRGVIIGRLLADLCQPQHRCWVAEADGRLVGVCGAQITAHRFRPDVPYLQEWALRVVPEYRGCGVGRQLWQTAMAWGKQRGAVGGVRGKPTVSGERTIWTRKQESDYAGMA